MELKISVTQLEIAFGHGFAHVSGTVFDGMRNEVRTHRSIFVISLPEFMNFKLFGKTVLVLKIKLGSQCAM